jgi:predicted nucleic acid-binding Zn ribbon protein
VTPPAESPADGRPDRQTPRRPPWDTTGADLAVQFLRQQAEDPLAPARRRPRRRHWSQQAPVSAAWSGAAADARDPQALASAMEEVVRREGWQEPIALHALTGCWPQVVGPDVAARTTPRIDGQVLLISCETTAWALQLEMMLPQLRRRIAEWAQGRPGPTVVPHEIRVQGPRGPSWRFGRRVVRGRGPRDTYG